MVQVRRSKRLLARGDSYRSATTIATLPDNVLLEIFDSYRSQSFTHQGAPVWPWHLLVHVCRKWRQIVFESPLRLDLQIPCTHGTPVGKDLSIWPALPIAISYHPPGRSRRPLGEGNLIEALKHPDRVCYVSLYLATIKTVAMVMQKPFPVLKRLYIFSNFEDPPVLPANFLGGSAPRLQTIHLNRISFPALPSLLLSSSNLVNLVLYNIPLTGYISPEAMVASLAALPRLKTFTIEFDWRSDAHRPDRIHPPPVTRTVLPALTSFRFLGTSEYLEDLVARIDGPQLDQIVTSYLNKLVDIVQVTQLSKFIDRSVVPNLCKVMHVALFNTSVAFIVHSHSNPYHHPIWNSSFCKGSDGRIIHITQVLSQFSAASSKVGHLKLVNGLMEDSRVDGMDDVEWLLFLRQFSSMQTLYVSPKLAGHVALALEEITAEMATETMPSLDLICLRGQPASSIKKFVSARRLSGRPVAVVDAESEMKFDKRLKSYVGK
ncbi:hypothetical protein EDB89DRAFT_2230702 [Lactarius sanguifluus]|nr:hypothetical protein EDB89DRAFT_2230702 [Lactarius sanguifluus]